MADHEMVRMIQQQVPLKSLAQKYTTLYKSEPEKLTGICPFHWGKDTSFSVYTKQNLYYCPVCQAAGDVIEFYKNIHNISYAEAIADLADMSGISMLDYHGMSKKDLLQIHALACAFYQEKLSSPEAQHARDYIHKRRISDEIVQKFQLGFAPIHWDDLLRHLKKSGFSEDAMLASGLIAKAATGTMYDRFRDRLMFPITDWAGHVIAFGGRTMLDEGTPKYINTQETPLFTKGDQLYGLWQMRQHTEKSTHILLTEGYVDVLSLHQFGFLSGCGILGTALTQEQVRKLACFRKPVDLLLDGDRAGRKAAFRSAEMLLAQGVPCRVVQLPDGEDPDSFLHYYGPDALRERIHQAMDGLEFCAHWLHDNCPPAEIMDWVSNFMASIANRLDLQATYIPKIAWFLGISEQAFRKSLAVQRKSEKQNVVISQKFTGKDKDLLEIAIWFPEEHDSLEELDIEKHLSRDGRQLWEKIRHQDVIVFECLDKEEKVFYVESVLKKETLEEPEKNLQMVMRWMRDNHPQRKQTVEEIKKAIKEASDINEQLRLLALLHSANAIART